MSSVNSRIMNKRGQLAIFIILALVIVGAIVIYFVVRERVVVEEIPAEYREVFDYYSSCIESEARTAIDLAGSQGGRVYTDAYVQGSEYAPSGNQLNFLGVGVPYWYYLTGSGLVKENVPSKADMQNEIARHIEENINNNCDFGQIYEKGFYIDMGTPKASVTINDESVAISVSANVVASKSANESARKSDYNIVVQSRLGRFYNTAMEIYNFEMENSFLENYSVDVLRNYAPVDGVEISCSGRVWTTREVVSELKEGLEANVGAIKFEGSYYSLSSDENKYFVVGHSSEDAVNLVYSAVWPTKVEVEGVDEIMTAYPVGTQAGMGVMGFCYAPYHFVYNIIYPVLIQVYDNNEMFQFPVVVVIDKNLPRKGIYSELAEEGEMPDICQYKTQDVEVNVYDVNLNKIEANLSYECFDQKCSLGETTGGTFIGSAPACVNGNLVANSDGYTEKGILFSSNEEDTADIVLDREYEVVVELDIGDRQLEGMAMVSFVSADRSASAALPDSNKVKLSEGFYNVTVYAYGNSSIVIPSATKTQCMTAARSGIAGFFGMTEEKCFPIVLPETKIDYALIGGGVGEIYLFPSDLSDGRIKLSADSLPLPTTLDELSQNYENFESARVNLE